MEIEDIDVFGFQFMKTLKKLTYLEQVEEVVHPHQLFHSTQPDLAALFFITQQIIFSDDPASKVAETLEYLNKSVLAKALVEKDYKTLFHTMRLLEACSVMMTQVEWFDVLLSNQATINLIKELALKPLKQKGYFAKIFFVGEDFRPKSIARALSLLQLWADITMYYQEHFMPVQLAYREVRMKKPSNPKTEMSCSREDFAYYGGNKHQYEMIRLLQRNLPRQFVDIPVLQMQQDCEDTQDFEKHRRYLAQFSAKMTAGVGSRETESHMNECALAFSRTYILLETITTYKQLKGKVEQERKKFDDIGTNEQGYAEMNHEQHDLLTELERIEKKMTFLFQYIMFFRSKHSRECTVKFKRNMIDKKEYDKGILQVGDISHTLKECKAELDKLNIKIKLSPDMAGMQVFPVWKGPLEYQNRFGDLKPEEKQTVVERGEEQPHVAPTHIDLGDITKPKPKVEEKEEAMSFGIIDTNETKT